MTQEEKAHLNGLLFVKGRESEIKMGGGIGMGNTCIFMADSCQCMTKTTTIKKKEKKERLTQEKKNNK